MIFNLNQLAPLTYIQFIYNHAFNNIPISIFHFDGAISLNISIRLRLCLMLHHFIINDDIQFVRVGLKLRNLMKELSLISSVMKSIRIS